MDHLALTPDSYDLKITGANKQDGIMDIKYLGTKWFLRGSREGFITSDQKSLLSFFY